MAEESTEKKEKKKKKDKKKGGGKVLFFFLGFLFGILFLVGGIAGAGYYVVSRPIKDTVKTVDPFIGGDLSAMLFGTEENPGILNEKYAEKKVMDLFDDVTETVGNLGNETASLGDLNEISPKVESLVDGLVKTLNEYGIPLETERMLTVPLKGLEGEIQACVKNITAGDLFNKFSDEPMSDIFLSICYGTKDKDFTIDEDGNVTMLDDAKKKTIGELTSVDLTTLLGDTELDDFIKAEDNLDNPLVLSLLYGKEGIHYKKTDTTVTVLPGYVYVPKTGTGVYRRNDTLTTATYVDELGRKFDLMDDGTFVVNAEKETDTDPDGYYTENNRKYTARKGGEMKINGVDCIVYNVQFRSVTLGDMMGENNALASLTETLTLSDVFDEETIENNQFLPYIKNEPLEELPTAMSNLKIVDVFHDEIYQGSTVKPLWKFLLEKDGAVDTSLKITEMDKLINNMSTNIQSATLNKLNEAGLIPNSSTLTTPLKKEIDLGILGTHTINMNGQPATTVLASKHTIGELTTSEIIDYLGGVITVLNSF